MTFTVILLIANVLCACYFGYELIYKEERRTWNTFWLIVSVYNVISQANKILDVASKVV